MFAALLVLAEKTRVADRHQVYMSGEVTVGFYMALLKNDSHRLAGDVAKCVVLPDKLKCNVSLACIQILNSIFICRYIIWQM